jgi:hypothetical protein
LPVVVVDEAVGLPRYAVALRIVTTAQQDVTRMDKVGKAEHKLPVALAVLHGLAHLLEVLQEH